MTTLARPEQVPIDQRAVDELVTTLRGELIRPGDGGTSNSDGCGTDRSTDTRR